MKQLLLSENGKWASTVTQADNGEVYIFALSQIDWREANSLLGSIYGGNKKDSNYLELVAKKALDNKFEVEIKE